MFPRGQLNEPTTTTDDWGASVLDSANQSTCGVPDSTYFQKLAAIHPYFLKYAGLDRESIFSSIFDSKFHRS